jgi:excisionase family DNA binding protein
MSAGDRGARMSNTGLYGIREAMEFLGGICRGTLYKLIKDGRLPTVTIGRRRFIRRRAMEEFLAGATTARIESPVNHRQMPLGFEVPEHAVVTEGSSQTSGERDVNPRPSSGLWMRSHGQRAR